jgi:hypothetical protein
MYDEITREFLATFRFTHTKERIGNRGKTIRAKFDVKFVMQQTRYVMSLDEFCKAINVQMLGVGRKSLVTPMRNSGHFGGALVWMFQLISIGVKSLIFNIHG